MADILSKGSLFPEELIPDLIQKTTGASALAKLCAATPIPFNGMKEFTFQLDKEVDIVAENGAKGKGGVTVEPITIVPIKIEYGARISDEFLYAAEDAKLDYMSAFRGGHCTGPGQRPGCQRHDHGPRLQIRPCRTDHRRRRKALPGTGLGQCTQYHQRAAC